eukprot:9005980-Pyramimonas_sp.AAC.1
MVVELMVGHGWRPFIAEGLPRHLGDAIEKCHCEFFDAARKMSPEELFDVLPMSFPMTRNAEGCDLVA